MSRLVLLLATALSTHARAQEPDKDGQVKPIVAISKEDYGQARLKFKTRLTKQMKAPGDVETLTIPKGVTEVNFSSGGQSLKAWINLPRSGNTDKRPAVLFLHGGFSFGPADWEMTKPYRDAGFIVMTPMLRGENDQSGVYSLLYDEVGDVLAAGEYLSKQAFVDPKRVHVAGHSVGGTLAMLAAMSTSIFSSAASFSGSPDQAIFCKFGIAPEEIPFDTTDAREVQMRSPLAFAASFKCPVRLYYGTGEPHFRLSTRLTARIAKRHHLDVESIEVEGGHFSALPEEMGTSIGFFHKH